MKTSERSAQRLANLHEIDRAILSAQSIDSLAEQTLSQLKGIISYQQGAIVLFNLETKEARILAGQIAGESTKAVVPITKLITLDFLQSPQPTMYVKDIANLSSPLPVLELKLAQGYHSFLSVAMLAENVWIGAIYLFDSQPDAFNEKDRQVVCEVTDQFAIAIKQSQMREQLQLYTAQLEQRVRERTAKLEETNQEMEAFAYSVSHDLRAPLRTIQGFAQALLEDYEDLLDDLGKEYARNLCEGAEQMDTLIADLLSYSRLSRSEIQLQPVDLNGIVQEALNQLKNEIKERQADISVKMPLGKVMAQRSILVQIVTNLVSNGIKFVEPETQPKIRFWTETKEDCLKLWIEDNGIVKPVAFDALVDIVKTLNVHWIILNEKPEIHLTA